MATLGRKTDSVPAITVSPTDVCKLRAMTSAKVVDFTSAFSAEFKPDKPDSNHKPSAARTVDNRRLIIDENKGPTAEEADGASSKPPTNGSTSVTVP